MQSMKLLLALTVFGAAAVVLVWAAESPGVTFVGHDKVAAALEKGGTLVTAMSHSSPSSWRSSICRPASGSRPLA